MCDRGSRGQEGARGQKSDVMDLEDLEMCQDAMRLGEIVWRGVGSWSPFAKDAIGNQFVRSVDSVAASLAEGFGRYHYADNKRFCYYSSGSLRETATWIAEARSRSLIVDPEGEMLVEGCDTPRRRIDTYISGSSSQRAPLDSLLTSLTN